MPICEVCKIEFSICEVCNIQSVCSCNKREHRSACLRKKRVQKYKEKFLNKSPEEKEAYRQSKSI